MFVSFHDPSLCHFLSPYENSLSFFFQHPFVSPRVALFYSTYPFAASFLSNLLLLRSSARLPLCTFRVRLSLSLYFTIIFLCSPVSLLHQLTSTPFVFHARAISNSSVIKRTFFNETIEFVFELRANSSGKISIENVRYHLVRFLAITLTTIT